MLVVAHGRGPSCGNVGGICPSCLQPLLSQHEPWVRTEAVGRPTVVLRPIRLAGPQLRLRGLARAAQYCGGRPSQLRIVCLCVCVCGCLCLCVCVCALSLVLLVLSVLLFYFSAGGAGGVCVLIGLGLAGVSGCCSGLGLVLWFLALLMLLVLLVCVYV